MKFTVCHTCKSDRSVLSFARRLLLTIAVASCLFAILSTVRAQVPTSDQYRISELERRANVAEGYGARLAVAETHYEELRDQIADIKTWTRGIGMALLIAVVEKLLGAFGIRVRKRTEG